MSTTVLSQEEKKAFVLPPIHTKVGEPFSITLEDNPSTGFTQALTKLPAHIALIEDKYFPSSSHLLGAPGTRKFTFVALETGEGTIAFNSIKFTHPKPTVASRNPMQERFVIVS